MYKVEMLYFSQFVDDPPPTRLSQLGVVTRSETATVYFIWEPPPLFARSDIAEYILTATDTMRAQNQSKITTVTGSSLELSAFINYSITVQQRTKCMDVSDPVKILFEPIKGENCLVNALAYRNVDMSVHIHVCTTMTFVRGCRPM